MPLPKNFLHQDIKSLELSKRRIIIGIIIAISFAFAFYSVTYLVRETLRVMSVTENYDLWILSKTERNFYNLFYAFISVIFGQSICFSFWLSKRRRILGRSNYLRSSIIIDQSVLNASFILWFSKMAFMFAAFFGLDRWGGFYVFSFYPDYKYLFVLISIVLFLQNWVTTRRIFKNKSLQWMVASILAASCLSITLSKINIVDYKSMNKYLISNNIYEKYDLQIPESEVYVEKFENRSLINHIYLVKNPKVRNNLATNLIVESKIIMLEDLNTIIPNWRSDLDEIDIPRMKYQLHIDTCISMKTINELRLKISSLGARKIVYTVIPAKREFDKRYYRNYGLLVRLPSTWISGKIPPPPPYQVQPSKDKNPIIIDIPENDEFQINGQIIEPIELKNVLKELLNQAPNYIVDLSTENHVNFASYFKVLSAYKKAIDELRNEYAFSEYLMSYVDLDEERRRKVQQQYPFSLYEKIFAPPKGAIP